MRKTKNSTYEKYAVSLKAEMVNGAKFVGQYEFSMLNRSMNAPTEAIPFDKATKTADKNQWVHFYLDDYRFEIMWSDPKKYLTVLKAYEGVISTDFSVYREMPLSMQIWNTYRNRAIAFWLQNNGIDVISNIRWGDERTYKFCFDGIPKNSTVAISTNGCIQGKSDRDYFKKGLQAMVEKLEPKTIVNYSYTPDDIFLPYKDAGIKIVQIQNYNDSIRKRVSA